MKCLHVLVLKLLTIIKEMTWHWENMTFKTTLNDLQGERSFSQNDLDNMKVKCTKFEVSISISVEVIENYLIQEIAWHRGNDMTEWVSDVHAITQLLKKMTWLS